MKILIGILLISGLGAGAIWKAGLFAPAVSDDPAQGGIFVAKRGDLSITLTERGTLKTSNAEQVRSQVQGRTPIQWLAEEGKRVTAGEIVVELDRTELERNIEDLQTLIIQLESEDRAAKTEELIQVEQNKTDIEKSELAFEVATSELAMFLEGDDAAQKRRLQLAIDTAESELSLAQNKFTQTDALLAKDFVTQDDLEDERIKVRKANEALIEANENQRLYLEYKRPLDEKQKRAAVTEAERGVERAQKQSEARLDAKKAMVSQKERSLNQAKERLAEKEVDFARMTITAPADGVIVYGDPDRSWDAEEIKVGGDAYFDRVLMTIPDSTEMAVTINVHEADIRKVKEGMRAAVHSELQRGSAYMGEVIRIDTVANAGNRRWGDTIRRFRVEVRIDGSDLDLKPGTSASVELQIGDLENVLHVPIQAVHGREGRFFCYVRTPKGPMETAVKVGRSNDAFLEIVSGISEGDQVLLYEPEPASVERDESVQETGEASVVDSGATGQGEVNATPRAPRPPDGGTVGATRGEGRRGGAERPSGSGGGDRTGGDRSRRGGDGGGDGGGGSRSGARGRPPGRPQP